MAEQSVGMHRIARAAERFAVIDGPRQPRAIADDRVELLRAQWNP